MRVTIVCHDLSNNCLGRAYVMGQLASEFAEVDIVGTASGATVWEPLRQIVDIPIVQVGSSQLVVDHISSMRPNVTVAIKPRPTSLGVALKARSLSGVPVVADVDDWEMAFYYDNWRWWLKQSLDWSDPNNFWRTRSMNAKVKSADGVTVASSRLRAMYGGTMIRHARKLSAFSGVRGCGLRGNLGLDGKYVLIFMGSPRPHKGLPDLIAAIDILDDPAVQLLVIGGGAITLPPRAYIHAIGQTSFADVPKYLACADLVVLPQRSGRISQAQVPAKLFDAMAMGIPIISTRVSDLAEVLGPQGVLVSPSDPADLARAIGSVMVAGRPDVGDQLRTRFSQLYSVEAVAPALEAVLWSAIRQ